MQGSILHQRRHLATSGGAVTGAGRQTVETPKAPGSESNFTGLPKNRDEIAVTTPITSEHMREHIEMVKADFPLVFKDIMDRDHFEDTMYFRDPITTNFNSFRVYQFVVQFLRYFLAPIYEVHEVRQAGDTSILVKWSWTMNFWWNRYNPLKALWDPRLAFTGLTVLGYHPNTGKWNKHVDAWDAVQNNRFFSPEAFVFAFSQMLQVSKPPNRFTPEFQIYKKYKGWEIRRYRPHIRAEVSLKALEDSDLAVGGGPGMADKTARAQRQKAETLLERYLALGNDRNEFFELTTPLFVSSEGVYSLTVPGYKTVDDCPKPHREGLITLQQQPERFYAAVSFSGKPSEENLQQHVATLRGHMQGDGSQEDGDAGGWQLARYNKEEWPKGPFRRNDVLIPLQSDSVDLWRGVDWQFVERTVEQTLDTGGL